MHGIGAEFGDFGRFRLPASLRRWAAGRRERQELARRLPPAILSDIGLSSDGELLVTEASVAGRTGGAGVSAARRAGPPRGP